jgi:hypothetical protein
MKISIETFPRLTAYLMLFVISSCASIFNSGSQSVIANADGDRSNIKIEVSTPNGSYRSQLPTTIVTTPSSFNHTTIIVKEKCYEQTQVEVGKSITPSFWANFLFGFFFPIGMGIDFLDGNMWKMNHQVVVTLNQKSSCA